MPYFDYDGEIHIDVNQFLSAIDVREKNKLIEKLITDGDIKRITLKTMSAKNRISIPESEFEESLDKLHGKWCILSKEEEEIIIKMAKRF